MPLLASTSSRGLAAPKIELLLVVVVVVVVVVDPRGLSYNIYRIIRIIMSIVTRYAGANSSLEYMIIFRTANFLRRGGPLSVAAAAAAGGAVSAGV